MHEKDKKYEILYPRPIKRLGDFHTSKWHTCLVSEKENNKKEKGIVTWTKKADQSSLVLSMVYSKQFLISGPQGIILFT